MPDHDSGPILVTGAAGYLGREIVAACETQGLVVIRTGRRASGDVDVVADLESGADIARAFDDMALGHVIHAAAVVPTVGGAYGDEGAALASVQMAQNMAAFVRRRDIAVTFVSSMTVYPEGAPNPVGEDAVSGLPSSTYAQGKRMAEAAFHEAGLAGFAARIPGLYGGARTGGLVGELRRALYKGETPRLPGEPLMWAAMDVGDAARAIVRLAGIPATGFRPLNVGYGGPISITRLSEIAGDVFGQHIENTVSHPVFESDLTHWCDLTGETPQDFEQAIRRYMT